VVDVLRPRTSRDLAAGDVRRRGGVGGPVHLGRTRGAGRSALLPRPRSRPARRVGQHPGPRQPRALRLAPPPPRPPPRRPGATPRPAARLPPPAPLQRRVPTSGWDRAPVHPGPRAPDGMRVNIPLRRRRTDMTVIVETATPTTQPVFHGRGRWAAAMLVTVG